MPIKTISSAQNPIFLELKKLLSSKGIHRQNRFFLWGEKFVTEVLKNSPEQAELLLTTHQHELKSDTSRIELSLELFKELDIFGTHSPILVCKAPEISTWNLAEPQGLELMVAMGEPSNLGAVIRSSISFGIKKIILLKESASPFHPKSVRASAGNILKVSYELGPSIQELKGENILALDMKGESLQGFQWPKNCYLLVGEEGQGVPRDLKIKRIQIPSEKNIESLNAGVALSIAMYSYYLQKLT